MWAIPKRVSKWCLDKLFILFATLCVLLPTSPRFSPYSTRDSGVFLYAGWRILHGNIPYLDIWDHKPPIIFYINAIGLWITNNSRWGVWIVEFISLFIAAYIGFKILHRMFGLFPAMVSTYLWMFSLVFMVLDGNLTEEYVLPLQFGSLYLYSCATSANRRLSHYLLIGVLGGVAFLTKQSSIGLWLAIVCHSIYIGVKRRTVKDTLTKISLVSLGGLLVLLPIGGYFYSKGSLDELWDAAFRYNFIYSIGKVSSLNERLWNATNVSTLTKSGIFQIAALGMIAFLFISKNGEKEAASDIVTLPCVALLDVPMELVLINLPGITYEHYYITILPALATLSGFLFYIMDRSGPDQKQLPLIHAMFIVSTICILGFGGIREYHDNRRFWEKRWNEEAINYVTGNSSPDDYVLVWGAESMVNFYAQRPSPSRFVYVYPLYRRGYVSEELTNEFLDDLIEHRPRLILDTMRKELPIFAFPIENDEIRMKLEYIESLYIDSDMIGSWQVYERKAH